MKPRCDCLNFCGDDPSIDKGLVRPCLTFKAELRTRRLHDAAPELLVALKDLINCADPNRDMAEIRRALSLIRRVEKD
jgi:hypothetical protein